MREFHTRASGGIARALTSHQYLDQNAHVWHGRQSDMTLRTQIMATRCSFLT